MNLLSDRWIPVSDGASMTQISVEELLCSDRCYSICHPRDDMELAALQLLVCLTQAVLAPENDEELRGRLETPLDPVEYREAAAIKMDWFDLEHEKTPFMQDPRVLEYMTSKGKDLAKEKTGIAKLLPGLPEGKGSGCLFNGAGDIRCMCPSCAAMALFNQATEAPSFGGGFKDPLRKAGPVTALIYDENLRLMVWKNALPCDFVEGRLPSVDEKNDVPNWILQMGEGDVVRTEEIGLLRGLFWQPASLFLEWSDGEGTCDCCGLRMSRSTLSFWKRKFKYDLDGVMWPHPHGARLMDKGKWNGVTFRGVAPLWTRFSEFLRWQDGHQPELVLEHYKNFVSHERLNLSVGGYTNRQASILERHHQVISLGSGWPEHIEDIDGRVELAVGYEKELSGKSFGLGKRVSGDGGGLKERARKMFFQKTESLMHEALQYTEWNREKAFRLELADRLKVLCSKILEEVARPYMDQPHGLLAYVTAKKNLEAAMDRLHKSIE
ncbi:type I-E CRISPR-associated protein Cse1/CasA [Dethiosulfovibrio sp. F2B]|uniref:type I-E CRISPR-associated protein Cse1/CasA n=1 Tax=Dethiosulfovibrio faecalis TaxID=2720018 RepID=UPI001F4477A7|nr:type I-E CRISPR-associated protein Cse1/CasA [Dethiosulfovibrio faecalis]MCF4152269.1 type I-E CRISPR-associated protein Cse1/CasA [Dethiosulfovibrio faecalis]